MTKILAPRTTEAAITLLERLASLQGQAALAEAARNKAIADTNAVSDSIVAPIAEEIAAIEPAIEAWWRKQGNKLLPAGRKTMELGGCMIGIRLGNKSYAFTGDDKQALAELNAVRWGKPLIRVTYAPDKPAIRKALSGPRADALGKMGFSETQPETFFVTQAEQAGTVTP